MQNNLSNENSAYLKQHKDNPIHWQPYGPKAFQSAKELNRPLFLSIGYSSCHWCHVMNHESFEDKSTAQTLNDQFVSIKVDREEHPEVDHLYQQMANLSQGRGGWPLSVFLTPELKPIFIGTYFPPKDLNGMPSFKTVLSHVNKEFQENLTGINEEAQKFLSALNQTQKVEKKIDFPGHFPPPQAVFQALSAHQDKAHGGYGGAPKFPLFSFYNWACDQILEGVVPKEFVEHITTSLEKMLFGGILDHLKGGLHRYSVDEKWLVPHFEKMLYDQAGLLPILAKLSRFYPMPIVFESLIQTVDYLESEMLHEQGHFMSAQDADSEGHEGLYFVFTEEEFYEALSEFPKDKLDKWFLKTKTGNFENGLNVIALNFEHREEIYQKENWELIKQIRSKLLKERNQRIPPATDPKGIASWNFMLISALCDVVQYGQLGQLSQKIVNLFQAKLEALTSTFLLKSQTDQTIRHSTTKSETAKYFEDYVFFAEAQLRLYEILGVETFKDNALHTAQFIKENFIKDEKVHFTTDENSPLVQFSDQSFRSPLSSYVNLLNRLSLFTPSLSAREVFPSEYDEYIQLCLLNPLAYGQGLSAFSYPDTLYRKIEVPVSWVNHADFQQMRSYFLSRFVISYHQEQNESWQICTRNSCEKKGEGIMKLKETFAPKKA